MTPFTTTVHQVAGIGPESLVQHQKRDLRDQILVDLPHFGDRPGARHLDHVPRLDVPEFLVRRDNRDAGQVPFDDRFDRCATAAPNWL
jgi:hypothetical protein